MEASQATILDTGVANAAQLCAQSALVAGLIQRAAGVCSGAVLLWHSPQLCAWLTASAAWLGRRAIADTVHWLMGAPAGRLPRCSGRDVKVHN